MLRQFTYANWTSGLRENTLPPFNGHSVADFEYVDVDGTLTEFIWDADTKQRWRNSWPKYYLEVKTTSNSREVPFHFSATQMQTVVSLIPIHQCR